MPYKDPVLDFFEHCKSTFADMNDICSALNISQSETEKLQANLESLCSEGALICVDDTVARYTTPKKIKAVEGYIRANNRGFAFLSPKHKTENDDDLFIPPDMLGGALDGDRVYAVRIEGTHDRAFVAAVLERGRKKIVGLLIKKGSLNFVIPKDSNYNSYVKITSSSAHAEEGDAVLCEIVCYSRNGIPEGRITEVLGKPGERSAEELAIIRSYGLYEAFSAEAEKQADEAARSKISCCGRRDFRKELTITIDDDDTRDIDDAVSVKRQGRNFILGVHIADVAHYVKFNTKTDEEAYIRGTSVYFPDRVFPMLPKSLSNGACSLNEGEDRYALSCIMTISQNGEILKSEICESVIRSNHRTTYREITGLLNGEKEACEKYPDLIEMCTNMAELCEILSARRDNLGNIDFDIKETHICIDECGNIELSDYTRTISEKIIEQFMICANETVAEKMNELKIPFIYRVHEPPAPDKVYSFRQFLNHLGISERIDERNPVAEQFRDILKNTQDKPYHEAVKKLMLRTMQKAVYSNKNIGHFGIGSKCYCHFTSPIRRYPDLIVHRIVKGVLHGETELMQTLCGARIAEYAVHCTERESKAISAERKVNALYKMLYISTRIGEQFDATISGISSYGIYAMLDNSIEGIIPDYTLPCRNYELSEFFVRLIGPNTNLRLGDRIKIRVEKCDFNSQEPQFSLVLHQKDSQRRKL